jgi:hypothetical protein
VRVEAGQSLGEGGCVCILSADSDSNLDRARIDAALDESRACRVGTRLWCECSGEQAIEP